MTHAKNVVQDCTSTILNKYRLCLNSCNLDWRQWKMGCNGCSHETDIVAPSRKHEHTCLGCFAEKHFGINRRQLMPLCALQCLHHLPLYTMWCCFESTQCDTNITQTLRCSIWEHTYELQSDSLSQRARVKPSVWYYYPVSCQIPHLTKHCCVESDCMLIILYLHLPYEQSLSLPCCQYCHDIVRKLI